VTFDGISGPISFANGARSRLSLSILRLAFKEEDSEMIPSFLRVGNWSEGISYDTDGLRMEDTILLSNEKPAINKTLMITTKEVSCYFYYLPA